MKMSAQSHPKQTILVVDDDPKITAMLRRVLTLEGYEVQVAYNGMDGLSMALDEQVELVVLDVMLPGLSGWEVCRYVREKRQVPILMLTARDQVEDRVKGLDTGADDYLVKPFALEELLARIRALLRRKSLGEEGQRTADLLSYADLQLDRAGRVVKRGQRAISLTAKEYQLLETFLENPERVLTRDYLMETIWGYDYAGESNVLEVHVANLRQKLEAGGESRLIHTVRKVGYILREDER